MESVRSAAAARGRSTLPYRSFSSTTKDRKKGAVYFATIRRKEGRSRGLCYVMQLPALCLIYSISRLLSVSSHLWSLDTPPPPNSSSDCHSTLIYRFTTHSKPIVTTSNRAAGQQETNTFVIIMCHHCSFGCLD